MHGARSTDVKRRWNTNALHQPLPALSARKGISSNRRGSNVRSGNAKHNEHSNKKKKDAHQGVQLPKLPKKTGNPFTSDLTLATQELRRTMMEQTGAHMTPGETCDETFSHTNVSSALDTFLGTATVHPYATEAWQNTQKLRGITTALSLGRNMDAGLLNVVSSPPPPPPPLIPHTTDANPVVGNAAVQEDERPLLAIMMSDVPWYKPAVKLKLLQQCCCYPDDTHLFRRHSLKKFSTASICSNASSLYSNVSSSSSSSSSHHPISSFEQQQQQPERKKRKDVLCTQRKPGRRELQASSSRTRYRQMREQRFRNAINCWCGIVSHVPLAQRDNPSELHETCMMRIYKEEERFLLAKALLRHQTMQQRERHRLARKMEEQAKAREGDAEHGDTSKPSRWRALLSTWTTDEGGRGEKRGAANGMAPPPPPPPPPQEQQRQEEEEEQRLEKEECQVTSQLLRLMPQSTNALVIQQSITQCILTSPGPNEKRLMAGVETGNSGEGNRKRGSIINSSDKMCIPLWELNLLIKKIAPCSKKATSDVNTSSDIKAHFHKVFHTFREFREGILFPPSSSVYKKTNWVERVIQGDDFSAFKNITQEIVKYINTAETHTTGAVSFSELPPPPQQHSRPSLLVLERYARNSIGSLMTVNLPAIETIQMLFPLRLYFSLHHGRRRVVTVDGLTLSCVLQSLRQYNTTSLAYQANDSSRSDGSHKRTTLIASHVDNAHGGGDMSAASAFDLYSFLSSTTDILGDPPHRCEALVAYALDSTAIVRQSQWRASAMKQLANEESIDVRRCILARVIVALSIHTVVSTQEKARSKTVSLLVPTGEGEATEEEDRRSQTTSVFLSVSPSFSVTESESQKQQQQLMNHGAILAAPTQRNHFVLDVQQLYFVAASALMENNEKLLPLLQRLRLQYRRVVTEILQSPEGHQQRDFTCVSALPFTQADADRVGGHLSSALCLLELEASYSEQLAELHRNECAVLRYNYHVPPYREFLEAERALWAPLYLRTLRLAHTFCVLLLQLGTLPIPPRHRPFLGPVLQLLHCHGGQKELRLRINECLLELEERAKRVRMPLLLREVQTNAQMELDAAAATVEAGYCSAEQIITCLAVPGDVVGTEPQLLSMPMVLFADVPPITG